MPKYITRYECCSASLLVQVPIMLRSDYCSLHDQDDMQLSDLGECPYDQVCNSGISHMLGFTPVLLCLFAKHTCRCMTVLVFLLVVHCWSCTAG